MDMLSLDFAAIAPQFVLFAGAMFVLIIGLFKGNDWDLGGVVGLLLLLCLTLVVLSWPHMAPGQRIFSGFLYADPFSAFVNFLILAGALLSVVIGLGKGLKNEGVEAEGEYYTLLILSTLGAMFFANAAEFITLFVSLEVMSMALYALCGSALSSKRSAESAMKYFFLGSFSSAFLLYGVALLYGLSGTMSFDQMSLELATQSGPLLYIAIGFVLFGLVFKLGAVPFHFWAPDVYQGAPTPVTAYMACVIKVAAVSAAMRVLWTAFDVSALVQVWSSVIWMVALLTMLLGNFVALRQRSLKRMLAYSSIGHAGYLLVAFLAPAPEFGGGAAILYYLVVYSIMTIGAFGVVFAVTGHNSQQDFADDITRFNGLGTSNPTLALVMSLFLLSLAGLPPGLAGLVGKFYIFSAAVKAGYVGLSIVGVLCSAVSCYYYLRVIVAMYFLPLEQSASEELPEPSFGLNWVLQLCAMGVIFAGVFPSLIYGAAAVIMSQF